MSEYRHYFLGNELQTVLTLPFSLEEVVGQWSSLRRAMTTSLPEPFTRDEWAYLMAFLDRANLLAPFETTFGVSVPTSLEPQRLLRPRGMVAVWLPNNVSLLGPLLTVLLSLSGNPMWLKVGSRGENLVEPFLGFAKRHLPAGALRRYLEVSVRVEAFDAVSPRNREMAEQASVRVIFGSDQAAEAVHGLPHPVDSIGISFTDRQSEAWVERPALDEATLEALVKAVAVFGQLGCTSPRRVWLLDGDRMRAQQLMARLAACWPRVIRRPAGLHIASSNVMSYHVAKALRWEAVLTASNAAVLAVGEADLPAIPGVMVLPISWAPLEAVVAALPRNIQTIGYALSYPKDERWLKVLEHSRIKRFVPVADMHRFHFTWDGVAFWAQVFEEVQIRLGAQPREGGRSDGADDRATRQIEEAAGVS